MFNRGQDESVHSPVNAIDNILSDARRLLADDAAGAADRARRIIAAAPGHPEARLILGAALRRCSDPSGALKVLSPLAAAYPKAWGIHFEAGAAYAALGETRAAIAALRRATELNPQSSLAWHALGDQLAINGDAAGAEAGQARAVPGSVGDPLLQKGAQALFDGDLAQADHILRDRFNMHPTDVTAVRLLADVAVRAGKYDAAEGLLRPVVDSAPNFMPARMAYAIILQIRNEPQAALAHLETLVTQSPDSSLLLILRGDARLQVGDYDGAVQDFTTGLDRDPSQPRAWMSYGHVLRTVGRQADSVTAYRRSLALSPTLGEAYWSLANLKVVRFDASDLRAMESALERGDISPDDRAHLHFALGKAFEDDKQFEPSFTHYAQGNALRRAMWPYDADANSDYARRTIATFTADFFAARDGVGDPSPDPIFIVGLPRSGSTLVEQILSSHSAVEGVSELPDLIAIASRLGAAADQAAAARGDNAPPGTHYPDMLKGLDPAVFRELGAEFMERTRIHRKLARPFFIDKLPNNFMQLGLIHLILPNAKVIDVRRHPMACCFSGFKQNFARGAQYSYSLSDLGRYYNDYLAMMAHFDTVLAGRVHRVLYEDLIQDPETEARRLLDYCGLPFESECLRFYESQRPVRTASSEQVRRPIFTEGLDHWRNFEPWLGPLRAELERILPQFSSARRDAE